MSAPAEELLRRLSATLRAEIGPAIDDDYVKTQAFMASTILERLARQLALTDEHAAAERADVAALSAALESVLADAPVAVGDAVEAVGVASTVDALAGLIDALYAWGPDEPAVVEALSAIRPVLRRDIDRRMEVAG